MTPAEIKAWQDQNGGDAGVEGPDASGITVYRAANGQFISVRRDGSLAMRGFSPPSEAVSPTSDPTTAATPAAPTAAPSAGGSGMNQQEIEAWIAQQGGAGAVQYSRSTRMVDNPAADPITAKAAGVKFDPAAPAKIAVPTEMWVNSKTGAKLHVGRNADGGFDVIENSNADPNKPASSRTAPPGGKPFIDDGPEVGAAGHRWGWNPETGAYDIDLGASPSAQNPKPSTESARAPVPNKPGVYQVTTKNASTGVTETHYEDAEGNPVPTPTEAAGKTRTPVQGKPGIYQVTTKDPATNVTETHFEDEAGNRIPTPTEAGKEERKPVRGGDGKQYTQVTKTDPTTNKTETYFENEQGQRVSLPPEDKGYTNIKQDENTGKWYGIKDGKWEEMPGGPGSAQAGQSAGPPLPQMVLGQSEAALREYATQLNAEVAAGRMTPAQRNTRMQEAMQQATLTLNTATLAQRDYESNLNANVNLATTRYNGEMRGIESALDFVSKINGTLKPGSAAGGKAFAAILGLQMQAAQRSGIYDVKPAMPDGKTLLQRQQEAAQGQTRPAATGPGAVPPGPAPSEVATPDEAAAAEAQRQQQAAGGLPDPVFRPQPDATYPTPSASAPSSAPNVPPVTPPGGPQSSAPSAPGMITYRNNDTGEVITTREDFYRDLGPGNRTIISGGVAPPVAPPSAPVPSPSAPRVAPQDQLPSMIQPSPQDAIPAPPSNFNTDPQVGPVGQTSPSDYAALAQAMRPQVPVQEGPTPGQDDPAALLHSQAAMAVPWHATEDEYRRYLASGVPPSVFWSIPGVPS